MSLRSSLLGEQPMYLSTNMLAAAVFTCVLASSLASQTQTKPIDPVNIDSTCHPCQDFFSTRMAGG